MPVRKKATVEASASEVPLPGATALPKSQDLSKAAALDVLKGQLSQKISIVFDLLIQEINALETQKQKQKQQEEQDSFALLLTQKKKQAEFEEKLQGERDAFEKDSARRREELQVRENELKKQEEELANLRKQVEMFPQELDKRLAEALKQTTADLKKDFEIEKKMLAQKYDLDLRLLNQQIGNLQTTLKLQEKENQSLKAERTRALEQMKDLAIAAVYGREGREKDNSTIEPLG